VFGSVWGSVWPPGLRVALVDHEVDLSPLVLPTSAAELVTNTCSLNLHK